MFKSSVVDDSTPLSDARDWLRERVDDGEQCPCCTQLAKVYQRKITSTMAHALIVLHRECGTTQYGHLPDILSRLPRAGRSAGGDEAKLRYWGLIEEESAVRDDGSGRTGWWRVTDKGELFIRRLITVPKYARVYDGRCLSFVGPDVSIVDALGTRFNYTELMMGV